MIIFLMIIKIIIDVVIAAHYPFFISFSFFHSVIFIITHGETKEMHIKEYNRINEITKRNTKKKVHPKPHLPPHQTYHEVGGKGEGVRGRVKNYAHSDCI